MFLAICTCKRCETKRSWRTRTKQKEDWRGWCSKNLFIFFAWRKRFLRVFPSTLLLVRFVLDFSSSTFLTHLLVLLFCWISYNFQSESEKGEIFYNWTVLWEVIWPDLKFAKKGLFCIVFITWSQLQLQCFSFFFGHLLIWIHSYAVIRISFFQFELLWILSKRIFCFSHHLCDWLDYVDNT